MRPVTFPPGDTVLAGRPFGESLFAEVDRLLMQGYCPDGRLEIETEERRLTCLFHRALPHLAGLLEGDQYTAVPLRDFPVRARQMLGGVCSVMRTDPVQVLLAAVHFRHRPMLQATTELVDLNHVLEVLERDAQDAALALERNGARTLLFLQKGKPARLFFGDPAEDPGEGDPKERFLLHVFAPDAPPGRVEVFRRLAIPPDPEAGFTLIKLADQAKPPPPAVVLVRLGGRVVLQRAFLPPGITVGRDPTCDLQLDNLSVSRRHARLAWDRGKFVIEDLGSANGTQLNGKPITRTTVGTNDRFTVGKFELSISEIAESATPDATLHVMPRIAMVRATLVGEEGAFALGRELTLGKAGSADVRIRGMFAKPVHARLVQESPGIYRVLAVGGATVTLNGRKVAEALLRPGDEIQVGASKFKLQVQAEPNTDPPPP
jgi:pSer/pThr/pTyr-binding forkhead associated (FHA) protein